MTVLSDSIIGEVNFDTFAQLVEERVKQMDEESMAATDVVESGTTNNPEVQAAKMRLAQLHIETASLLRTLDISAVVFRIVTKLDHLIGERCEASKKLLVRMFEDTRGKPARPALSTIQLVPIERYFDFTVEQLRRHKRDITEDEKSGIQSTIIAMIN